jgi:inhibitor of KinA sporulation pathway (predicted exonuclease)
MTTHAHYLVVDLEATCDENMKLPREETEIIEIGAVLVASDTLAHVAEFQTFVKPIRHPTLTPFCTRLTTITQAQVDAAPKFPLAIRAFAEFLKGRDFLFCSWGDYDRAQFERDGRRHGVRPPLGRDHWNLKEAYRRASGETKKLGNGQALREVGLRQEGTAHRGIDDARNIARLLPFILGRLPFPGRARSA